MAAERPHQIAPDDIIAYFERQTGAGVVMGKTEDLLGDYGVDGDDAFEFIEAFADEFGVNVDRYRYFFHHDSEGDLLSFFRNRNPAKYVKRIPVSLDDLVVAARTKAWSVEYSETERAAALRRAESAPNYGLYLLFGLIALGVSFGVLLSLAPRGQCPPEGVALC